MTPADILRELQGDGTIPVDAEIRDWGDVARAAWSGSRLTVSSVTRNVECCGPAGYASLGLRRDPTPDIARVVVRLATDGI